MRVAVLVSSPIAADLRDRARTDRAPRQDFFALADALDAQLIAPVSRVSPRGGKWAKLQRLSTAAWGAFRLRDTYDLIITDTDRASLLLAILFRAARARKRIVAITHGMMTHRPDLLLMKRLGLTRYFGHFVCYGPTLAAKLEDRLKLEPGRVVTVRHAADHRFWRPLEVPVERHVFGAGMLRRDYPTLVEAVRGLDVQVTVAAFSPWMDLPERRPAGPPPPDNVRFTRLDPVGMREVYAKSITVAVPLDRASPTQDGSLVVYEAMAMGKPVILTRTSGQEGLALVREGETGFYVECGDVAAWRDRLTYLLDHPEEAERLGRRARTVVEAGLNLDRYVDDFVGVVRGLQGVQHAGRTVPE